MEVSIMCVLVSLNEVLSNKWSLVHIADSLKTPTLVVRNKTKHMIMDVLKKIIKMKYRNLFSTNHYKQNLSKVTCFVYKQNEKLVSKWA